jgi:hypothetical protein
MFVGSGGEQKQNGDDGGQENNNNHYEKRRWFLVCEADYMVANNLNNTREGDDSQPINLMREDDPADQYYLSCDDDKDYTHSNRSNNNNYSPFFNVKVYNNHTSNDLFHLRQKSQRLQQTTQSCKASDNTNTARVHLCYETRRNNPIITSSSND